jgi:predicted porin
MKKLYIVLLALAVGVFFASTALAFHEGSEGTAEGALGVSGTYYMDAESNDDNAGGSSKWYDDEMELVLRVNLNDVTAVIDFEITDDETWDGSNNSSGGLLNGYWIQWAAMDNLNVKIGEYAPSFGHKVLIYADPQAHHIGLTYGLDSVDLGFYLGKVAEGATYDDEVAEDDIDSMTLTANIKGVDFFSKLNFIYVSVQSGDDSTDGGGTSPMATFAGDASSYLGFDSGFTIGPVGVALEYGSVASDVDAIDGGNFMLVDLGLDDLVGFDLNVHYFSSSEEFSDSALGMGVGDYYPYRIIGWRDAAGPADGLTEVTLIGVSGSYAINDKATFTAKALVSGEQADNALGTEVDLGVNYKFADNVSARFDYNMASLDDENYGTDDDSATDMRARFTFKF